MAKYRRNRKKKSKRVRNPCDTHHLLFIGRQWNNGDLAALRKYWYCKKSISRDTLHRFIHDNISTITPPKPQNAGKVLRRLQRMARDREIDQHDSLDHRLSILISLFNDVEPRTALALQKELDIVREFYGEPSD